MQRNNVHEILVGNKCLIARTVPYVCVPNILKTVQLSSTKCQFSYPVVRNRVLLLVNYQRKKIYKNNREFKIINC